MHPIDLETIVETISIWEKSVFTFNVYCWVIMAFIVVNLAFMIWFKRLHPLVGLAICMFVFANGDTFWVLWPTPIGTISTCLFFTQISVLLAYRSVRKEKRRKAYLRTVGAK